MKKKSLRILTALLSLVMAAAMTVALVGCFDGGEGSNAENGYKIVLDSEFPQEGEIPYADEIVLPTARVEDENGTVVSYDIEYRVKDKNGDVKTSKYSSFELAPGDYTAIYYYSEKVTLEKTFRVKDDEAPKITFENVPNDLFLGEDEAGFLPAVDVKDASSDVTIDKKLFFAPYGGEKKEVSYNKMNDSFKITEAGTFTFTVTATDDSSNSSTESIGWLVKDPNWTDENLEKGYYSDFDEEGYLNTVKTADISVYWNTVSYTQEWLESFEGANGVMKTGLTFTGQNNASVRFRLVKPIKWTELAGKYIVARVYVEGDGLKDYFGFAGNQKLQLGEEYSAATERKTPLVKGRWVSYYLDCDMAKALCMFSDSNDDKANPTSDITDIQLCFSRENEETTSMTLYVDGFTVAEKLPDPENLKAENGVLSWSAVENAKGYNVSVNGTETFVTKPPFALPEGKGLARVSAVGDDVFSLSSGERVAAFGLTAESGDYASFNDELYTYLIDGNVNLMGETTGYTPSFVGNSYVAGKVVTVVGKGGWGICTAVAVNFPQKVNLEGVNTLVFGMKVTIGCSVQEIKVYDRDYNYELGTLTIEEGKTLYTLDISGKNAGEINGVQFVYNNRVDMVDGTITFEFDYIAPAVQLGKPELTVNREAKKVTWTEVPNATAYAVLVDGEKIDSVTSAEYDCSKISEMKTFAVYAEGYDRFLAGETASVGIRVSGGVWADVVGSLKIKGVSYATDGLLQIALTENSPFNANDVIGASGIELKIDGKPVAITSAVQTDDPKKINISVDLSLTKKGDIFTITSESLFIGPAGNAYSPEVDFSAVLTGIYDDYSIWSVLDGTIELNETGWCQDNLVQFTLSKSLAVVDQTSFDCSLAEVYANGERTSGFSALWHASVSKLQFNFTYPGTKEGYDIPTLLIKKGSIIFADGYAYLIDKDVELVYSVAMSRWSVLKTAVIEKVSWPESARSVQFILTEECWSYGKDVDASGATVLSNGQKVENLSAIADTVQHIHLYGNFSTEVPEGAERATLVIKAGSVFMQESRSIRFDEDFTLVWDGANWCKA